MGTDPLIHVTQTKLNHPINDRKMQICKQRELLNIQKQAINQQLSALSAEQQDIELHQKGINRLFHELKHEMIMLNPRDGYGKATT